MLALERLDEVTAHRAANASIHHLDDLLVDLLLDITLVAQNVFIDTHLTKLILDNREAEAMILREKMVQQRRLALFTYTCTYMSDSHTHRY